MVDTSQTIADLPEGGFFYEPRSLWDIKAFELTDQQQTLAMNREHFCNTEPYPVQIERIVLAPINYGFRVTPPNMLGLKFQSSGAVLDTAAVLISAPFRYHFNLNPIRANGILPSPTGQPRDPQIWPSSAYGVTALNFSRRTVNGRQAIGMTLPRNGSIVWDLSAANRYIPEVPLDVKATMVWQEAGGLWPGSARTFGPVAVPELATAGRFPSGEVPPNPEECWPYCIDAFAPPAQAGNGNFWQPQTSFSQQRFVQQEASRQGSTLITGMRVHLDQVDMDTAIAAAIAPVPPVPPICEASMRIGCRVQTTGGGSNRDWWRPGAPLCLVLDTITPACVYELQKPFTLKSGDTLDVQMVLPAVTGLGREPLEHMYQLGVAFNGWAAIEA